MEFQILNDIMIPAVAIGAVLFFAFKLWGVYEPHIKKIMKKLHEKKEEEKTPARKYDEEHGRLSKEET